jgi:hypothetical protein
LQKEIQENPKNKMTLEDAIHQANIILPEHKEEFIKQLKRFPYGIEKWLYRDSLVIPDSLYQGDILFNLPTCFIDEEGDIIEGEDFVALISNTCDMQPGRRDFVIISPIVPFDEYKEHLIHTKKDVENVLMDIRKNRIFGFFYLPPREMIPESFIDFSRMVSISSTYVNNIKISLPEKCLLSLSPYGFYLFLIKLTFHLARMETPTANQQKV